MLTKNRLINHVGKKVIHFGHSHLLSGGPSVNSSWFCMISCHAWGIFKRIRNIACSLRKSVKYMLQKHPMIQVFFIPFGSKIILMNLLKTFWTILSQIVLLAHGPRNLVKITNYSLSMKDYFFDKTYYIFLTVFRDSKYCNSVMTHQWPDI
jgi:hypothetical protein